MEVEIQVSLLKLKKHGRLHGLRRLIARYLTAEVVANYKFSYKSDGMVDGQPAYLFSVSPRKKRKGLF